MNKPWWSTAAALLLLTGCSAMPQNQASTDAPSEARDKPANSLAVVDISAADRQTRPATVPAQDRFGAVDKPRIYSSVQGAYKGRPLTRHVGDYVKNLTQDLISNMEYISVKTPVAVTHFALLDSDLQKTNLLGQQMAESFMHELHKFRIPVLDHKATDYIRITDLGDFMLSRDYLDLNSTLPIEYVLTGTMAKHQGGVLVNARILGIESRAVVASAQMLIPFYVVDALIPSDGAQPDGSKDGVKLSKG